MKKQKSSRDENGRFLPGSSGNPKGRPAGHRNWAPLLVEALLDGQAEALARKVMKMALEGDTLAMRLCMDRLMPPRRERHMTVPLPPLTTADNIAAGFGNLAGAVSNGEVTPAETASARCC